jgi:hypothetical protein
MSAGATFRAFPSSAIDDAFGGMSLRDWFAGQALSGMTANPTVAPTIKNADIASICYSLADAMLAEREKGGAQ